MTPSKKSALWRPASLQKNDGDRRRCKEGTDTSRKSNHNFAAQSHGCGKGRREERKRQDRGWRRGVFATVGADRSAGHSNTEFPVWHFTEPFEQDGA